MTTRAKRITIGILAALAVVALAIPKIIESQDTEKPLSKSKDGDARAVDVRVHVVLATQLDDKIAVTGTISPNEQVEIQSEIAGKITGIYFREGAHVRKGALLIRINDSELQAQLKRANFRRELAVAKEGRQRQLRDKNIVSAAEYDIALNELNMATADIALIRAQLAKTRITAPFSGKIGLRYVSQGSYISPSTRIATLSSVSPVKIDFSVPERYFKVVNSGSTITFHVQGIEQEQTGRVYAVEPRIDQATRTLQVRAVCDNASGRIMPGAFAEITLVLKQIGSALMVPTQAVIPELQGAKVFVVKHGKAEPRPVQTGIRTDRDIQILSGIAAGDTVITSGVQQVKAGRVVKIE